MVTIATVGPQGSQAWQAAQRYLPQAQITLFPDSKEVICAFEEGAADFAVIPIYNTREGQIKEVRVLEELRKGYWIDNIVLPIQLSLGALDESTELTVLAGSATAIKQCEDFIAAHFPDASILTVKNLDAHIAEMKHLQLRGHGVIETEAIIRDNGLVMRQREVAPHNRTRFAVLGPVMTVPTGHDSTALFTQPLRDRVGLLYDILGEFSSRGISLLDLRSENDVKSQRLRVYIEAEGHVDDPAIRQAVERLEGHVIQEARTVKVLGSYPRVEMRTRYIKNFGFIGSGPMSRWFVDRLNSEGYPTLVCGRSTVLRPQEMIPQVDVVVICVPISATGPTVQQYGALLRDGQALILLAGEAEDSIDCALAATSPGVELMLVHNLWGPKAATMKDKNAVVVRTNRSGQLCSEFESFLYKHGAEIFQDTPAKHDLLMGVSQKLPTAISLALAMTLRERGISPEDIASHSTLTSLYGILAMARIHVQNPQTYAEIMAAKGQGNTIVDTFYGNLKQVMSHAESGDIAALCATMVQSRDYLSEEFLAARMEQALAVDQTLGRILLR
ncbi:MAG: prephenate dehydrogenase/arogenate dehydrogenase family protein [Desulfobulbaceae bacterium]|nr:prephenate dehydrogenase/arogenate dehydrogenase family protein [Desulfobulbaceae bacterium]